MVIGLASLKLLELVYNLLIEHMRGNDAKYTSPRGLSG